MFYSHNDCSSLSALSRLVSSSNNLQNSHGRFGKTLHFKNTPQLLFRSSLTYLVQHPQYLKCDLLLLYQQDVILSLHCCHYSLASFDQYSDLQAIQQDCPRQHYISEVRLFSRLRLLLLRQSKHIYRCPPH